MEALSPHLVDRIMRFFTSNDLLNYKISAEPSASDFFQIF